MITYVDTSFLVKLLVAEPGSARARQIWEASDRAVAVRLVEVEAAAALAAAERAGRITVTQAGVLLAVAREAMGEMVSVEVTADLIRSAASLARQEALRGYDAVHLAGALVVGADVMASADKDLCAAAARQGLYVADPLDGAG